MSVTKIHNKEAEYFEYLSQHIEGVRRTWEEILKPCMLQECLTIDILRVAERISTHDKSKYGKEEFDAYLNWFYSDDDEDKDEDAFNLAWLHHQKCNPHHWQYWILEKDSGEQVILDMPYEYVVEMLCDWHSFSLKDPESTAYNWYQNNKDKMKLSDAAIQIIEKYIDELKEPLGGARS